MTTVQLALLGLFATSLLTCVYIYFGYPALIFIVARLRPRPVRFDDVTPTVTALVPVHDEEEVIADKIANLRGLEYPPGKLDILVLSDGSTDRSHEIVRGLGGPDLDLLELPRGGKIRALNAGAARARGEILMLTDANSMMQPGALLKLVRGFADPEVGGVCGNQVYRARGGDSTEQGENLYWRYDKWQKGLESAIGSIFAADGSLYAIRRELYTPIDDPAQADDIAISARVVLQGYRLLFERDAVTYEDAPVEGRAEFRRKVRVTNRSVRALLNLGRGLWSHGFYSLELLSHKLLRHMAPLFLLATLASNLALAAVHPLLAVLAIGQVGFYLAAVVGFLLRGHPLGSARLLTVPYFFCLANTSALLGIVTLLRGDRLAMWQPRGGAPSPKDTEI